MDEYMILGRNKKTDPWEVIGFESRCLYPTSFGVDSLADKYARDWNFKNIRVVKVDTILEECRG